MDTFTPAQRSRIMAQVKSKNTKPEMIVRRLIHSLGYRYRLHRKDLPGTPDLVFPSLKKVIFIHGCFWHQHRCKRGRRMPVTHHKYWSEKLTRNVDRDRKTHRSLRRKGWDILLIWECQIPSKNLEKLTERITQFLKG